MRNISVWVLATLGAVALASSGCSAGGAGAGSTTKNSKPGSTGGAGNTPGGGTSATGTGSGGPDLTPDQGNDGPEGAPEDPDPGNPNITHPKCGNGKCTDFPAEPILAMGAPANSAMLFGDPSNFDAGTAYVAADGHLTDGRAPLLYKTTDFGVTWTSVSGDLPSKHPLDYTLSVAENPNRKGMLFAGTGHGFYYTLDDGVKWTALQTGLPAAPVTWVVVQKQAHDVVLSTYGRGLYILDDITPLEQPAPAATDGARLFVPRPAYRLARSGRAQFTYSMPAAAPLKIEIADAGGAVVRTMELPGRAGLNRLSWDLRYDAPRLVALRTTPPENPNIWSEPRFLGQDTRPVTHWGLAQAQVGPLAAPGKYTLKVTTGGHTLTQPFEVLKDPRIVSSDADLVASTEMQKRIVKDLNETSDMVNHLETVRRQIEDKLKASQTGAASLRETDAQLASTEYKLIEKSSTLSDDKYFVQAYKIYSNLIWLNGAVGTGAGDEAGGADYRPTDTQVAVLQSIEKDLAVARAEYQAMLKSGLLKP